MKSTEKSSETKLYNTLIVCCLLYYIFYMCVKNVYSAEVVEVMKDFGVSKRDAGISTTTAFAAYGIVQLILARFIHKVNIPKMLCIMVPLAMLAHFLTAFCTEIWQVWVLFGLGGGLAAGIFPSILTVLGRYLPDRMLSRANSILSLGFSLGFVVPYLGASVFIGLGNWRMAFIFFPIVTTVFTFVFCRVVKKCHRIYEGNAEAEEKPEQAEPVTELPRGKYIAFVTFSGMLSLFSALIFYGLLGWITSLLNEEFGLTSSASSLTSVLIPLAVYVGPFLQARLCRKNSVWYVGIIFSVIELLFPITLALFYRVNIVLTLLLSIVLLALDRGLNNLAALEIPLRYRETVNSGTIGTLINIFGCVGAAAGAPLMGSIIDTYGHSTNYWFTAVLIVVMLGFIIPGQLIFSKKPLPEHQ